MFWMQHRVWLLGSSNSHKTWSASLTWLCQSFGLPSRPPRHHSHSDFALWFENVKKSDRVKSAKKIPITARHIWRFIRDCLGIVPDQLHLAKYDDLIKALALAMFFLTASRSTELLWSDKTEDPKIQKIITGVRWSDISIAERSGFRSSEVLGIKVKWFKNQEDRRQPKKVRIVSPCCGKSTAECICPYFAIIKFLKQAYKLRKLRRRNPQPFHDKKTWTEKQSKNLGTKPENFVFVNARGTILGYSFIYKLTQDLVAFNKIDTTNGKITPHSLRIGATSLAHHQHIDPLKMMRYVEWRPGTCPTMHAHYVRYTEQQLAVVPYEMLHGTLQFGEPTRNFIRTDPERFELRNEVIRAALYQGKEATSSNADLKARKLPTKRKPIYDIDVDDRTNSRNR